MSNRLGDHYNRYSKTNYSESNINQWNGNNYKDVYSDNFNIKHSLTSEPTIQYEEYTHFISISSKDRDRNVYPDVNNYCITLPQELKNILSVQLIQGIIPAKNNVEAEPYLLLDIDELEEVVISNDINISKSFAILQPSSPITTEGFIQIDKRIHENTVKIYKTPRASLSKLTVSIKDCLGQKINFGTDTLLPIPMDKSLQNTFIFKVVTLEKRRSDLHHRNVF
jgi:hypothetical protein